MNGKEFKCSIIEECAGGNSNHSSFINNKDVASYPTSIKKQALKLDFTQKQEPYLVTVNRNHVSPL